MKLWPVPLRGTRGFGFVGFAIAHATLLVGYLAAPQVLAGLSPSQIAWDAGSAYIAVLPFEVAFPYVVRTDQDGRSSSALELFENGKRLGPAHSGHAEICERGHGRYSHWGNALWFAASDSSDPRINGRSYTAITTASVSPVLPLAVAVADLLLLIAVRRRIAGFIGRRSGALATGGIFICVAAAALVAGGVLGRVNASGGPPKDPALVLDTLRHAILGVGLVILHWLPGIALARLLLRTGTLADLMLLGFPLGMGFSAALAAIVLLAPHGTLFAALCWIACALGLIGLRPSVDELRGLTWTAMVSAPFSIGFGCWLGLLWHGPTDSLPGSPTGDLVFYAASIELLSFSPFPHLNLGYERVPFGGYYNQLFPSIGAALGRTITVEPFLFVLSAGGAFFVFSLALALRAYVLAVPSLALGPYHGVLILWLSVIVAMRYPTWAVESVPMIYLAPVVIAVAHWVSKPQLWASLIATAIAVVGSALGKVVAVTVLGPVGLAAAALRVVELRGAGKLVAIAAAGGCATYAVMLLARFADLLSTVPLGPTSRQMAMQGLDLLTLAPYLARDLSSALLAFLAFLFVPPLIALCIAGGFLLFLTYPFLFNADFLCSSLLFGLFVHRAMERRRSHGTIALAALSLAVPAILLTDPSGWPSGIAWLACVGGASGVALSRRLPPTGGRRRVGFIVGTALGTTLTLCLGLVAVARGYVIVDSGWRSGAPELTPAVREIWFAVRELTPSDALIFTDQVSLQPRLLGSWNTYASMGRRQVFVSNLYQNEVTSSNLQRATSDLRENEAVLTGKLAPDQLHLRGRYSAYFAVVSIGRSVPGGWRRVFANEDYALYAILASP